MFEVVEKHKATKEERTTRLLEVVGALAICFVVGIVLWFAFAKGG